MTSLRVWPTIAHVPSLDIERALPVRVNQAI
jgi:hypothetical protein